MFKKNISFLGIIFCLISCSTPAPVVNKSVSYSKDSQARVRFYGQNGHPTIATYGIDCSNNEKGTEINIGGNLGDALGSFVGTVKSQSIGIPSTEISRNLGAYNKGLSRAFFQEFALPAGKAVNVMSSIAPLTSSADGYGFNGTSWTRSITTTTRLGCNSKIGSFIPEAGQDYEVIGANGYCGIAVFRVEKDGQISPVELNNEVVCK